MLRPGGLTLFAIRLGFFVLESYARGEKLLIPGAHDADLQDERKKFVYVAIGNITIALGILVPPAIAATMRRPAMTRSDVR